MPRYVHDIAQLIAANDAEYVERADARFWAKVDKTGDDGCWIWRACTYPSGHGAFGFRGLPSPDIAAHRYSYARLVGSVPLGLELDHLCGTPGCVNPAHLEPVTHRENILRGDAPIAHHARYCTRCRRGFFNLQAHAEECTG